MTPRRTEGLRGEADAASSRAWVQTLYRRQARFVWNVLRGLGVPESSVEDAVQEVFVVVYRKRDEYAEEGSERSWLFRIARFVAANQFRTLRRKGGGLPFDEQTQPATQPGPEEAVALRQAADLLERFLGTLDDAQREVFVSIELAGMTAPEVAEAVGAKQNSVYSRLRLAREKWERFVRSESRAARGGTP